MRIARRTRTPRSLPAIVAALLVGVLVFGQLSTLLHRALVVHARCVHGEFVHVEADGADPPGSLVAGTAQSSYERDATSPSVHAHEHCAAAAFLPSGALLAAVRRFAVAPAVLTRLVEPPPESHAPGRAVLRFAPKTSPPLGRG